MLTAALLALALAPAPARLPFSIRPAVQADDPDRLYANRTDLASAERAASLWEARLARDGSDFEAAWKLARACYWIGGHVARAEQRRQYERGVEAGRRAAALEPKRPEGYFWMAANMGALAESFGLRQGLRYRGAIKDALETVLRIDPAFQDGSADRALGRWYLKVPGLFGGSKDKSIEHLRRSLTYDPHSTASHYFLAETLLETNRRDEARVELQQVLDAPVHPNWAPEDEEFKAKARALLATLRPRSP
ncbi:MAG: tetratricopeptide repeat protein [Acidobacteria bacterium]|nr:tetratricopeptide repeat protein [Acidobacteriota bacterium]